MSRPLRVLLLEDNASDALLIFRELKRAGFEAIGERVETEEAFRAQLELGPDVVLADFLQPEFDAVRALKMVQESCRDIPVIVITGALGDEAAVELVKAGAADYLVKDRLARLGQAVRHALAQKEARADKRRAERALQESEARKSAILEAAGDAIITIDEHELIESANRAAIEMFGYTAEEILRANIRLVMPPLDCEPVEDAASLAEPSVCERMLGVALEAVGRKKDDTWFPIERTVTELQLGERRLFMATIRDISERKKSELDLVRRTNELAHSNIELEQFASIASHDLQEPLRTIGGFAQLLARRCSGQLDSPANEFIAYIVNGVTRMQTLINDLLEYSRLGTHGLAFRQVSCESVLERVLEDLNGSIARTGAVITHDALPEVWADRSQMSQLFQNLIANAIHYRANAPPRVHITAREEGDYWEFSVEDNGIGFDPKQSERIFVIFQRLHTTEQYPGSGMGLAVCRKIVERHFGRIWAESQPGKGSRFFFTLPGKDIRA